MKLAIPSGHFTSCNKRFSYPPPGTCTETIPRIVTECFILQRRAVAMLAQAVSGSCLTATLLCMFVDTPPGLLGERESCKFYLACSEVWERFWSSLHQGKTFVARAGVACGKCVQRLEWWLQLMYVDKQSGSSATVNAFMCLFTLSTAKREDG